MTDYKTTDYCRVCGASPREHLPSGGHTYVPSTIAEQTWNGMCPAGLHGLDYQDQRCDLCAGVTTSAKRDAPLAHVPGAVRVKTEDRPGMPQFGVLVGMLLDERGDMQAVVRLDHFGLMLKALHPSKVTPVTPDEEEAYKP
jgi:hypothetical protein